MNKEKSVTQLRLEEDLKVAMKAGDKASKSTIREVLNNIKNQAIENRVEFLTEEEVIEVIVYSKKQVKAEMEEFQRVNRLERVAVLQVSSDLMTTYLPVQIDEDEMKKIVDEVFVKLGDKANMGTAMKEVLPLVKGKIDNKLVSAYVQAKFKK